ncbi:MAG TPA: 30S ribosomal protein S1 [Candidatus Saccharimonadales bacterium]|nr:30S ribosomal protein S1 [Candidatus Saccharimonadales bacterium]
MSNPRSPESQPTPESNESFEEMLSSFERTHNHKAPDGNKQLEGTVVAVSAESVFLDIGYKTEGILPLAPFQGAGETVKVGDKFQVSVKGRDPEGYYELSRLKVELPTDWSALEQAFEAKTTILGTVTAVIKGGLSVDVGVRAFMPSSRSGERDAKLLEKMVGEQIRCRIIKLDVADEDVVVDRRVVLEEEERATKEQRYNQIEEGATLSGSVRSLADYGAFIDLGGVDALLHVSDMAWGRVSKPGDVLTVGQQVEVKVLKIDAEKHRISVGLKQLQAHPWDAVAEKYKVGERIKGTVTRVVEFGAFVELEPGIEGLIHLSEMSWGKKVRKADDVIKPGETVEAVILSVSLGERRISLGLKQALGDPWALASQKFAAGTAVEGPVTSITKFGAFVQLAEGIEGMVHVSEISAEKRIEHPQDVLKLGQVVQAQVLELDIEKRQIRLSMKQLVPTGLDEYIAEHKIGDVVTGRLIEESGDRARVELGEGIQATCQIVPVVAANPEPKPETGKLDMSSLSAMLNAKWKGGGPEASTAKPEAARAGQIRSFRIVKLDAAAKKIGLELA